MLSMGFRKIIRPRASKSLQQSNTLSSKDNDDGEDNHLVTHRHIATTTTNAGRIIRQGMLNIPHHKFNTGVARQRLHDSHALHHGPVPLSLAASADNGSACIVPDDSGKKPTAKIKNDDHDETDDNNALTTNFRRAILTTPPPRESEQVSSPRHHFDAHQYHHYHPSATKKYHHPSTITRYKGITRHHQLGIDHRHTICTTS